MIGQFEGVFTALITPFKHGEVDERSFERLLEDQLEGGVEGFVVNGTTGESPTLAIEETRRLFEIARKTSGSKIPILVGTGSNSTSKTIELTLKAADWGADGALVVTPYYNKPPQRGLIAHFRAVAEKSPIPVLLYNVPSRTVARLEPATVSELAHHPRIVGLKEATGDLELLAKIQAEVGEEFSLLSGDDPSAVEFCARGGRGVISVISHLIPGTLKELVRRARNGDSAVSKEYERFHELNRLLYIEANPIGVKAALFLCGLIDSPELRLPLVSLAEPFVAELKNELRRLSIKGVKA